MRDQLDVTTITLHRALKLLDALGAQYKVIMPEGDGYGTLNVVTEPEKPKKGSRYGYGELRRYYKPLIEAMEPGDVTLVPVDRFDLASLAGGISSLGFELWGYDNCVVTQRRDLEAVQVMRVG